MEDIIAYIVGAVIVLGSAAAAYKKYIAPKTKTPVDDKVADILEDAGDVAKGVKGE